MVNWVLNTSQYYVVTFVLCMIVIEPRTVYCQPAVVVATIVAYEKLKDIHKEQLTVSNPFSCGLVFL